MTSPPSIPIALCGPFDGAHLVATLQIVGLPKNPIAAGTKLMAGRVDVLANGQRMLTVYGRSATEAPMQVAVFERDWDKLVLVLDSPLALCHAARWLAMVEGADPGATAPLWYHDGEEWVLSLADGEVIRGFDRGTSPPATTPAAEALAAACVAVGGAG